MKRIIKRFVMTTMIAVTVIYFYPNPLGRDFGDILGKRINKPEPKQPAPFVIIDEAK